jgi:hypothetical protein
VLALPGSTQCQQTLQQDRGTERPTEAATRESCPRCCTCRWSVVLCRAYCWPLASLSVLTGCDSPGSTTLMQPYTFCQARRPLPISMPLLCCLVSTPGCAARFVASTMRPCRQQALRQGGTVMHFCSKYTGRDNHTMMLLMTGCLGPCG